MRLLLVEDEAKLAGFLRQGLEEENYAVDLAYDGQDGAYLAETTAYDLVILDLNLPKLSGLEVLRRIRHKKPNVPVLIMTAKSTVENRIEGLDCGADDYVVKPIFVSELAARIRALLRRGLRESFEMQIANLAMNTATRTVTRAGQKIELSSKEFALLEFLMRNAGRPVSRTSIIEHVWDLHFDSVTNVVDVYINYLRKKIDNGFSPHLIHTIRGFGYLLTDAGL